MGRCRVGRFFKRVGRVLVGFVAIIIMAFTLFYLRVEWKRNAIITVDVKPIDLPSGPDSVAEGKRLVQVKACSDCHGEDLAGRMFINEPAIGRFSGSNLTPGRGSVTLNYKVEDWVRSIRFGIAPNGRPLVAMPAGDFHGISNEDLGKMIAYLKSLPPTDRESELQSIGPVARILYSFGQMPLMFPYEDVDLESTPIESVESAPTVEYGRYLSQACTGCHGPGFAGGHIPGTPPEWPDARNLTPSGSFGTYTLADFEAVLREGVTPDGRHIDPQYMPWKSTQAMTDVEIEALYKFLKQLPPRPDGTR